MVAFVSSTLVSVLMGIGLIVYARRRPVGSSFSWGEAMVGSAYIFFLAFMVYGVVPHQWLTMAENEWAWRGDKFVHGYFEMVKPKSQGGWFPFDLTYRAVSDTVATVIYGVFIGMQIWLWQKWQARDTSPLSGIVASLAGFGLFVWGLVTLTPLLFANLSEMNEDTSRFDAIINYQLHYVIIAALLMGVGSVLLGMGFLQRKQDVLTKSGALATSSYGRPLVKQG